MKLFMTALIGLASLTLASPTPRMNNITTSDSEVAHAGPPFTCCRWTPVVKCHVANLCYTVLQCTDFYDEARPDSACPAARAESEGEVATLTSVAPTLVTTSASTFSTEITAIKAKTRGSDPLGDKYFVCSKSRTSVLICRFGFCSMDHYCSTKGVGTKCQNECACCKSSIIKRHRLNEEYAEGQTLADDHPSLDDRTEKATSASLSHNLKTRRIEIIEAVSNKDAVEDPCTPGKHKCIYGLIYFCSLSGTWQFVADCGGDAHCFQRADGSAYCLS